MRSCNKERKANMNTGVEEEEGGGWRKGKDGAERYTGKMWEQETRRWRET